MLESIAWFKITYINLYFAPFSELKSILLIWGYKKIEIKFGIIGAGGTTYQKTSTFLPVTYNDQTANKEKYLD